MNASRTLVESQLTADSELHEDVSLIAQMVFARANQPGAATRHVALMPRETLELDLSDPAQRIFGDYELLEPIGEGGMGVVYRARQISLDREVAVKLLAAGPWASAEFVERFRREAQNAARMQHPNIVAIYEVGAAEDLQFFSMRLVRGESLAALLRRDGVLAPQRAAQLLRTVAEAVDYAHRLGVLHLDLKPANVLLDENGIPHVADFGLARRLDQDLAADNDEVSGTPSYMAPEQAVARGQITPATDIWGLGAILYELLCGQPPFLASSPQGTLQLVVTGTLRSPRRYRADLPRDLEAIILKCMSRDTAQRYPSGRALADDLTRFLEGREVRARPLNRLQRTGRWARREPKFATAAVLAALALIAGLAATTQQWRRAEGQRQIAESNATISADRLWEERRSIAMRLMEDGKGFEAMAPLIDNVDEQERAGRSDPLSVERRELGMIEHLGVTLIDRTIVPPGAPLSAAALSPDGDLIAVALGDGTVHWYDTATMTERGVVDVSGEPTSDDEERAIRLLRFVDSHRLRVTLDWADFMVSPSDLDTVLVDLDQARILRPTAFAGFAHAEFSADGDYALLHNRDHQMQLWHVAPWEPVSPLVAESARKQGDALTWIVGSGGRHVARFTDRFGVLELFDPRRMSTPLRVALPAETTISSCAETRDGTRIALGDTTGHVYLVDVATRALRMLPASRGREVTWVEFSEDGAWLAAARLDGQAFAFDVVTGEPLDTGTMTQPFPLRHVAINHRERLLVALGPGDLAPAYPAIWRLAEPSNTAVPATRILSVPNAGRMGFFTSPMSERNGLLATATVEGNVRLWRLPHSPLLAPRSARQAAGTLHYDGAQVIDTAHKKLRVASTTGAPPSPWVELPQPVNVAEISASGRTLVAISGHELRVFDPATMQQRGAPVDLPATPVHLVVDEDRDRAVLTFGRNTPDGFEEILQVCDLASPRLLPDTTVVRGPLREFEFTADGTRLIATGPVDGSTDILDPTTLAHLGGYKHNHEMPVVSAALQVGADHEQDRLLVVTDTSSTSVFDVGNGVLVVQPGSGRIIEQLPTADLRPLSVTAARGHVFVAGRLGDAVDPSEQAPGRRITSSRPDTRSAASISHGGRLIARAFRAEVQIYDVRSGALVGPRLAAELDPMDDFAQLAFSPDDRQLLARTRLGRWVLWTLEADSRSLAELRSDERLLNPEAAASGPLVEVMPDAREHALLRARDPGPAPEAEPRPEVPVARLIAGVPLPARTATDPLLLDLTKSYTLAPDSVENFLTRSAPDMSGVPIGVVRAEGIDYDLRGLRELGKDEKSVSMPSSMTDIEVPAVPIAAVRILLFAAQARPSPEERIYAHVRLHYVDGSAETLPIRTQVDVPGYTDSDRPTPFAFMFGSSERLQGNSIVPMISNPRLANPHPERIVRSLDILAIEDGWSEPAILAITAEPVIGAPPRRMDPEKATPTPREEVP